MNFFPQWRTLNSKGYRQALARSRDPSLIERYESKKAISSFVHKYDVVEKIILRRVVKIKIKQGQGEINGSSSPLI